jgi:hypothetical protein
MKAYRLGAQTTRRLDGNDVVPVIREPRGIPTRAGADVEHSSRRCTKEADEPAMKLGGVDGLVATR